MTIHIFIAHMGIGGAERVCVNLANEFVRQQNKVNIIVLNLDNDINTQLLHPDISVHSLGVSRLRYSMLPMYRYIRKHKPGSLFVFGNEMGIILNKMKAMHLIRTPLVVRVLNNVNISLSKEEHVSPVVESYLKKQQKELGRVEHVISQCKGMEQMLLDRGLVRKDQITTIYNPVSNSLIQSTKKLRVPFSKRDPDRVREVVFIGRIDPQKQPDQLLRVFSKVLQSGTKARLHLVGDGILKDKMVELAQQLNIKNEVIFEGITRQMDRIYAMADAVILSSEYEGMPNCLIEAIGCGIPVVSYDCPIGPSEIVVEGENGYLTPLNDMDALADKIVLTLNRQWDEKDIQKTSEKFHVEHAAKACLEVLEKVSR